MPTADENEDNKELACHKSCFTSHKVVNKDGRHRDYIFLKANQPFKRLVNLADEEIIGKKIVEIITASKLSFEWGKLYDRVLVRDEQLRFSTYISKENSWYEVVIYKLTDNYLVTTFTDIKQNKITHQREEIKCKLKQKILDSVDNHIAVVNQNGVIEYVNQAWMDFARENNAILEKIDEGANYLAAIKADKNQAESIYNKLKKIIKEEIDNFSQEYTCHAHNKKRWFKMYAKRVELSAQTKILLVREEITKRERSRQVIRRQAKLRKLVNRLSSDFINLSLNEVDQTINEALKQMGEFIAADRCYIFLFNLENTVANNKYLWQKEDVSSLKAELQHINTEKYPWIMKRLSNFSKLRISSLEDLPSEAVNLKQLLQKSNVKSCLILPIVYDNNLLGLIGFDSVKEERYWSQEAVSLLKISGELFAAVLKRKENEQRLADYTAEVEESNMELEYISNKLQERIIKAQKLHQQFLPSKLPQKGDLDLAAYYQPAEKLGGDFYNVIEYKNKLLFYIVDITGHGLDGAMLNIFIRESINSFLLAKQEKADDLSPKEIIEFIYQRYCQEDFPDDYFICTILGVIDLGSCEVRLINAGIQIPALITDSQGFINELDSDAPPISGVIEADFFAKENLTEKKFSLNSGDSLLLATDGLIEEEVEQEIYGSERLKEVLKKNYFLPTEIKLEAIKQDFVEFSGDLATKDDITLFSLGNKAVIKDNFSSEIVSDLEQVYQLLAEIAEFIEAYSDDFVAIQAGIQEMLINAIEHGNQLDESKTVKVKIEVIKDYLRIIIKDQGSGFNWYKKALKEFEIEKEVEIINDRGRGIRIANQIFDSICYNQKGNHVYLIKFI